MGSDQENHGDQDKYSGAPPQRPLQSDHFGTLQEQSFQLGQSVSRSISRKTRLPRSLFQSQPKHDQEYHCVDNAQELLFPQEPLCQPDLREDNAQAGVGDLDNKDNLPLHSLDETKW